MKFLRLNQLVAMLLLSVSSLVFSKDEAASNKSYKLGGKLQKELFANRNMNFLNDDITNDCSFRYRTTLDGNVVAQYGDLPKNPAVEIKISGRLRYDVGTDALVKTMPVPALVVGVPITVPSSSIGKTIPWLRELCMKISLDEHEKGSDHYLKFGSFAYELGRGIALGSAYASGGFLGLDPRFSIDQFAPGGLLHTDVVHDILTADFYFSLLSNPNGSFKENNAKIHAQQVMRDPSISDSRGPKAGVYIASASLNWKAINLDDCKLTVNPYGYIHPSPDQNLEFTADVNSQLYGIGNAIEFKVGKFEWGFDGAFQGGNTRIKAWDRNLITLKNDNGIADFQYTKVYSDALLTVPAVVTNDNKANVVAGPKGFVQNGQPIPLIAGSVQLWNGNDRFRPEQTQFYHGYFWVTDMSYDLIDDQLKLCLDTGLSSGQLDDLFHINGLTEADLANRNFNGYVPIQSVYSGKRIQHLVMLNTGVPRFTVQDPSLNLKQLHVPSKISGTDSLTDKFTNIAYAGSGFEWKPAKFTDQKLLFKPVAIYYWMVQAPYLPLKNGQDSSAQRIVASHALGTALSIELEATLKECINVGGYAGLMIPGKQYQQFQGTRIKGDERLGSSTAYVVNFFMAYKF